MIKGNVNISHITYDMLESLKFNEKTETKEANGFWKSMGIPTPNFPNDAAIVFQTFGENCPSWINDISSLFSNWVEHSIITVNKLLPGCFIPPHKDTLYRIKQKVKNENIDVSNLYPIRINLFLQDKQLGHIYEMDGKFLNDYKQGDYVIITPNKYHCVSNIGYLNRYTMQITGFTKLEEFL